jgi:hypothetical protein
MVRTVDELARMRTPGMVTRARNAIGGGAGCRLILWICPTHTPRLDSPNFFIACVTRFYEYLWMFTDLEGEEWRPVVGYEAYYAVSNLGRYLAKRIRKPKAVEAEA